MKWLDSWVNRAAPAWMTDADYRRVTLPRLTRPNLVARLYMLCTAFGTAGVGWGIPTSATARIMDGGGLSAHAVIGTLVLATIFGTLDVVLNDGFAVQKLVRADSLTGRFAVRLEHRRTPRCFLIGGCYLVLTFAGSGSHISGTFWLLLYYIQMAFCAGLLGWSLRALVSATAEGGRDATA